MTKDRLPLQPLESSEGVTRFRANLIVRHILEEGGIDLNDIAALDVPDEDRVQFAQLIGYSVGGFADLSYVDNETYEKVMEAQSLFHMKEDNDAPH